jgi:hypothetical protein
MVHQPLVGLFMGFKSVNALFDAWEKTRCCPLPVGLGFLRRRNEFARWPALANDLPNRIIDIHHGVHGSKLSLPEIAGKRQKEDRTRSGAPFSGIAHF